ncbi:MAG TPA: hypothetical protein VEQ17_01580 [Steroidobacteraceae bacterium]|nr:hypothetical protein [Steroidobacteraceae bacterium]
MPVPWKQIITWAPQLITLSRELLARSRATKAGASLAPSPDPADMATRVAALEENERRQAELVDRMAEQVAQLSGAVTALHRRQRWLIGAIVLLAGALLWLLLRH